MNEVERHDNYGTVYDCILEDNCICAIRFIIIFKLAMGRPRLRTYTATMISYVNHHVAPSPVHFFSHGSTMMLGEESTSAAYWKKCGDEALANGIKGVIMMVDSIASQALK